MNKEQRIISALSNPRGLNRFEAENHGDHCLNSTISRLKEKGYSIYSRRETVPNRFSSTPTSCNRYWLMAQPE